MGMVEWWVFLSHYSTTPSLHHSSLLMHRQLQAGNF
jgi:hypothetical protein